MSKKDNYKSKRKGKILGLFVAGVLLCTTLLSVIGFASNGWEESSPLEWFKSERNKENLILYDDENPYLIKDEFENDKGLKIRVTDNGTIKVNGKSTADQTITIKEVTLEPGEYTISGYKSDDKASLIVTGSFGEKKAGVTNDTFILENTETVTVSIFVAEDSYSLNRTFRPCIVVGKDAGNMLG